MSSVEFHNASGRVMFRTIGRLLQVCPSSEVIRDLMLHSRAISGGGFIVFTVSQNRPHTRPCPPLDQRPFSSRASLPSPPSLGPRRCARCSDISCHRPPWQHTTRYESTALFCPLRRRLAALRLLSFRGGRISSRHVNNYTVTTRSILATIN